jgi:hypothetical protein
VSPLIDTASHSPLASKTGPKRLFFTNRLCREGGYYSPLLIATNETKL